MGWMIAGMVLLLVGPALAVLCQRAIPLFRGRYDHEQGERW
jgi:hypothetical protein